MFLNKLIFYKKKLKKEFRKLKENKKFILRVN